jgi:hypothetical protein
MSGGVPVGLPPPGGAVPVALPAPGVVPALPTVEPAPQPGRGMPALGAVLGVFWPVVVPGTV